MDTELGSTQTTLPYSSHYAHTLPNRPETEWEPLEEHLENVASLAGEFAAAFGAADWGRLAGLWHDLGKYSNDFQARLLSANGFDAHLESLPGRVDHATAGAQHAENCIGGIAGRILAYCIAGHHAGLADAEDGQGGLSGLSARLKKQIPEFRHAAPKILLDHQGLSAPSLHWDSSNRTKAFQLAVFCRMLFSCLVDADYLATEGFMGPDRAAARSACNSPTLADLLSHLDAHLEQFRADTLVNRARAGVLAQCRGKAELPPGIFSLTVPTGGGKTLSSLAFALRHANRHGLRRVIYAIPFTSIIEQNVDVFRAAIGSADPNVVLEHHSGLDPDKETLWGRLATENWDAPLVVTTNVQLFESLFANRPSRCRKLHRIARSVIILDECQSLPVTLLAPTLRMLEELRRNYGCTIVLCSATQPAIAERPDFRIGLQDVREIVDDPPQLYQSLRRVEVEQVGKLEDSNLVEELQQHEQVLCVVNTRSHAARLFVALRGAPRGGESVFHLSASMCAAHRTYVLDQIRARLDARAPKPCSVVSTQLIEAGVDIDFPVVYRALAGLDSIAQAAGRCNREGRLSCGRVFIFECEIPPGAALHEIRQGAQGTKEVAGLHRDLLSLDAIEQYFRLSYWTRSGEWDKKKILDLFALSDGGSHFQFREAAERYRLIPDAQTPVLVSYGARGRNLIDELRARPEPPGREFDRRAQRYVVGVYEHQLGQLRMNHAVMQYYERFWVLENESNYDQDVGLRLDSLSFRPERFCV